MSDNPSFTQEVIDKVRFRVWLHFLRHVLENSVPFVGMRHIWFPSPSDKAYSLREGNPPADCDRPWWLRRKRLEVDCTEIPDWLREAVRPGGTIDDWLEAEVRDRGLEGEAIHMARIELFERYANKLADKGLQ